MGQGTGAQVVGGLVTFGMGVIIIAALYQLGKQGNPTVGAVQNIADNTLGGLFK